MSANEVGKYFIAMIMQGKSGGCSRAKGDVAAGQPPLVLIGWRISAAASQIHWLKIFLEDKIPTVIIGSCLDGFMHGALLLVHRADC